MRKRLLALILSLSMLAATISITGCSQEKDKGAGTVKQGQKVQSNDESSEKVEIPPVNIKPIPRTEDSPGIDQVYTVAPDILAVTITAGNLVQSEQILYEKQAGDEIRESGADGGQIDGYEVIRDGKGIGYLAGGPDSRIITTNEYIAGDMLQTEMADLRQVYSITSEDDPNYSSAVIPTAVNRKSKPVNMADSDLVPERKFVIQHILYLRLPHMLVPGKSYKINFSELNVKTPEYEYKHEPERNFSEAVHVSQIGFRPDDPGKRAFLSIWLGTGGPYEYGEGLTFKLLNDDNSKAVFEGKTALSKTVSAENNGALTYVYSMDFGEFAKPGRYRVYVDGVGCSYPFEINEDVWKDAFVKSMRGFYHNRSGIELGAPYTDYVRPRPYHPEDGLKVYQSAASILDSGNGLNAKGTDKDNFGNLIAGKTEKIELNGWGGYFDAGDWDRRIQHLEATRLQLELLLENPEYFKSVSLNIPESDNDLPDVLDEALWNLDFYRRLQTSEGGIRGGIEAEAHPRNGETSWTESLTVMVYAPDHWSSYIYAGVAARAAYVLESIRPELAKTYRDSAIKAMKWAEAEYDKWLKAPEAGSRAQSVSQTVHDERNLAAAELYRLTGDKKWHNIFLDTTYIKSSKSKLRELNHHIQRNAAFVYAMINDKPVDKNIQKACIDAIVAEADFSIRLEDTHEFNITAPDWFKYHGNGYYGTPDVAALVRAHYLTGKAEYLAGVVKGTLFGAGANPLNMTYTTGVGIKSPQNPLHIDSRRSGQKVPEGITIYGNFDVLQKKENWMLVYFLRNNKVCTPYVEEWPNDEFYMDIYLWPDQCEWTIMENLGPNAYAWGYLASRK